MNSERAAVSRRGILAGAFGLAAVDVATAAAIRDSGPPPVSTKGDLGPVETSMAGYGGKPADLHLTMAGLKDLRYRIGKFFVADAFIVNAPHDVMGVLSSVLILEARHDFACGQHVYLAVSPLFDVADGGGLYPPEYDAFVTVTSNGEKTFHWRRR